MRRTYGGFQNCFIRFCEISKCTAIATPRKNGKITNLNSKRKSGEKRRETSGISRKTAGKSKGNRTKATEIKKKKNGRETAQISKTSFGTDKS